MLIPDSSSIGPSIRCAAPDEGQRSDRRKVTCIIGGGGAIGILGVTALGTATQGRIIAICRPNQIADINQKGFQRTGVLNSASVSPERLELYSSIDQIPSDTTVDRVLIFVKCYDVEEVARQLSNRCDLVSPHTAVVTFQNGWGSHRPLLDVFAAENIYNARVITGVTKIGPSEANVTVHGDDIRIGSLARGASPGPAEELARDLRTGGVPASATGDIARYLLKKLLYNVGVNALGAIYGVSTGGLVDTPGMHGQIDDLIREAYGAFERAGYSIGCSDVDEYLDEFYRKLIPTTRDHKSSMLQDLERDVPRPRTEVDSINGAVVAIARAHGGVAPANERIVEMIHEMEKERRRAKSAQRAASVYEERNEQRERKA